MWGGAAQQRNHSIWIEPLGAGRRYTDRIELDAGWLTAIVAGFAALSDRHRQRRWRRLARRHLTAPVEPRWRPGSDGRPGRLTSLRWGSAVLAAFAVAADVGAEPEVDAAAEQRRAVCSDTRRPVWMSRTSRAWSRRPIQVLVSGAASRASISAGSRKNTSRWVVRLVGMARTRWISSACSGWRRAA